MSQTQVTIALLLGLGYFSLLWAALAFLITFTGVPKFAGVGFSYAVISTAFGAAFLWAGSMLSELSKIAQREKA